MPRSGERSSSSSSPPFPPLPRLRWCGCAVESSKDEEDAPITLDLPASTSELALSETDPPPAEAEVEAVEMSAVEGEEVILHWIRQMTPTVTATVRTTAREATMRKSTVRVGRLKLRLLPWPVPAWMEESTSSSLEALSCEESLRMMPVREEEKGQ